MCVSIELTDQTAACCLEYAKGYFAELLKKVDIRKCYILNE